MNDWTLSLELGLDDAVDDDRFGSEDRGETPCRARIFFGFESSEECEEHPDESKVAEFGKGINDSVGGLGATEAIEELIHTVIETINRTQLVWRIEFMMRKMQARMFRRQLFDSGVDDSFGRQLLGLFRARHRG